MKTQKKRTLVTLIACVAVIALLVLGFFGYRMATGKGQSGTKSVTVTVCLADGTQTPYVYQTEREYLGEVLADEKLAEGTKGEYGLFITTVAGVTADDAKQQWWCITKSGESVTTGADTIPIADGDQYEITLMEGY